MQQNMYVYIVLNCVRLWNILKSLSHNSYAIYTRSFHAYLIYVYIYGGVFAGFLLCLFHHNRPLRPGETCSLSSKAMRFAFLSIGLWRHCLIFPGGIHFPMLLYLTYLPVSHVVYKLKRQWLMWHWCGICFGISRNSKGNDFFIIYGLRRSITTSFLLPDWVQKGRSIMVFKIGLKGLWLC